MSTDRGVAAFTIFILLAVIVVVAVVVPVFVTEINTGEYSLQNYRDVTLNERGDVFAIDTLDLTIDLANTTVTNSSATAVFEISNATTTRTTNKVSAGENATVSLGRLDVTVSVSTITATEATFDVEIDSTQLQDSAKRLWFLAIVLVVVFVLVAFIALLA